MDDNWYTFVFYILSLLKARWITVGIQKNRSMPYTARWVQVDIEGMPSAFCMQFEFSSKNFHQASLKARWITIGI